MKIIKLLTDEPLRENDSLDRDGLGFDIYAQLLAGAVLGTPGPFTVGIFGEWGTGKTSLMRMIKGRLDAQEDIITVWFDAWRYEQDQHPIIPLIATTIRSLNPSRPGIAKLRDGGKSLLSALVAVANGFSVKSRQAYTGVEIEAGLSIQNIKTAWHEMSADPLLDASLHHGAYEKLAEVDLGSSLKVVILIDDLDRCFPDQAIKLLESIKLVLSHTGFIFILGVSRMVLEGYLEHRYKQQYGIEQFQGYYYLDKLVQLPFHIPPHRERMRDLSESLLRRLEPSDAGRLQGILPIIGAACGSNPRATVRFVNNLLIDKGINRSLLETGYMTEEIPIGYFAVARSLQQRWIEVFTLLAASDTLCSTVANWLPNELAQHTSSEHEDEAQVASWMIGDQDLQELLLGSKHGRDWLRDSVLRAAAIQFLQTKRKETALHASQEDSMPETLVVSHIDEKARRWQIAQILSGCGLGVKSGSLADFERLDRKGCNIVWIIGSDWHAWEDPHALSIITRKIARIGPLFLVLFPEAKDSTIPERLPHVLALLLSQSDFSERDLRPLVAALQRLKRAYLSTDMEMAQSLAEKAYD